MKTKIIKCKLIVIINVSTTYFVNKIMSRYNINFKLSIKCVKSRNFVIHSLITVRAINIVYCLFTFNYVVCLYHN